MQCNIKQHGAVVKQSSSPEDESTVVQRCSHEGRAKEMHRSGYVDAAEEMQ